MLFQLEHANTRTLEHMLIQKTIKKHALFIVLLISQTSSLWAQSVTYYPKDYERLQDFDYRMQITMDTVQAKGKIYFTVELIVDHAFGSIWNPYNLLDVSLFYLDTTGRYDRYKEIPLDGFENPYPATGYTGGDHHQSALPEGYKKKYELLSATVNGKALDYDIMEYDRDEISLEKGVYRCQFVTRGIIQEGEAVPIPAGQYYMLIGTLIEYEGNDERVSFQDIPVRLE